MRKQPIISTALLAGALAFGLAFLPACSSGDEAEPAPVEEAQEEAAEEQEAPTEETAEPEQATEPLSAWIITNVSGEAVFDHTPYTTTYTLDEHGNYISSEGSYSTTVSEYDEYGNILRSVDTMDSGTITTTYEYELDDAGRPLTTHYVYVDESPDNPGTTAVDVVTEYHDNGIVSRQTADESYAYTYGDEEVTGTSHSVTEYDERGYLTRSSYEMEGYSYDFIYVWEFDDAGNPVSVSHVDSTSDEPVTLVTTFKCDENGNIVSRTEQHAISSYDEDGNVSEQEVVTVTRTYEYTFVEDCSQGAYDLAMLKN